MTTEKVEKFLDALEGYEKKKICKLEKIFHGGFNKIQQQIDVRVRQDGRWIEYTVYLLHESSHTFEITLKGSEESEDGMRMSDSTKIEKRIVHEGVSLGKIEKEGVKFIALDQYEFYLDELISLMA
jgi:hypothetical protein